ncbi:serine/threonine protein kinase [Myxococcota bacterium]|nr:serine/threonine protein kinase [Myxococcota bacterium]
MPAISKLPVEIGRLTVVEFVGAGSGAEVYRAHLAGTMGFSKQVALKLLPAPPTGINARQVQALVNEARIGGRLQHPNLCEVYEFGCSDGYYYISMEFLDGVPLSRALRVCRLGRRRIPPGLALTIATQVCRGLDHAHRLVDENGRVHHLVHRDLKPANLMLTTTDMVKVMDFGIAKSEFNLFKTSEGLTRGTPMYMSPEQVRGERLGPPSDLFSLGVIVFEMLTGDRLFEPREEEDLVELLERVARAEVGPALGRIRAEHPLFHGLLERCLMSAPEDRFADAREMLRAMEELRDRVAFGRSVAAFVADVRAAEAAIRRERIAGASRGGSPSRPSDPGPGESTSAFFTPVDPSRTAPSIATDGSDSGDSTLDLPSVQIEVLPSREDGSEEDETIPSRKGGRASG